MFYAPLSFDAGAKVCVCHAGDLILKPLNHVRLLEKQELMPQHSSYTHWDLRSDLWQWSFVTGAWASLGWQSVGIRRICLRPRFPSSRHHAP